jgi:hypothetical protein
MEQQITLFLDALAAALSEDRFVRLTLSDYRGEEEALKSLTARRIVVKREEKLSFTYRYQTRDIVKNYGIGDALSMLQNLLTEKGFKKATLFTSDFLIRRMTAAKTGMSSPMEKHSGAISGLPTRKVRS